MNKNLLSDSRVMERELFNRIVQQTKEFCDDAVLGVSLWGEPSRHPGISDLAATVCSYQGLSLVIETSGIGWNRECLESIASKASRGQVTWIVSLDALSGEL